MGLSLGTRLGSCEILGPLGAGGMGEVYKARDHRLGRNVAVKVLPESFARDGDRVARFEREAQVLASLNHPNIAAIHDVKEVGGSTYLILELVEGETLTDRIARGPVPVTECLHIAQQIADALDAAHEQGIVHRDLKPDNIKITPEGRVKVLDFGLAKINGLSEDSRTTLNTQTGVILGTPAYMSPEQAQGKHVDRRTDAWAFGCVVYEMLTGRRAFPEAEWKTLPDKTPSRIRLLLQRCLQKDPRLRWSDMAMARIEMEEAQAGSDWPSDSRPSRRPHYVWAAAVLALMLLSAGLFMQLRDEPTSSVPAFHSNVLTPQGVNRLSTGMISPDATMLAYTASSKGKRMVWVWHGNSGKAEPVPGTEGSEGAPFWSPDSLHIRFFAGGELKKVALGGGSPLTLASVSQDGSHFGTANEAGDVLLSGGGIPPVRHLPPGGASPIVATELDSSREELSHRFPNFLPDGRHFTYLALSSNPKNVEAYIGTLGSKDRVPLPGIASEVRYSSGHVLFIRNGSLMAQPFDLQQLKVSGEAFPVVSSITERTNSNVPFSVSANGSLAYGRVPGMQLVWIDRKGNQVGIAGQEGEYSNLDLSPDGKYVAFARGNPPDIWVMDIAKGNSFPLTRNSAVDQSPKWRSDSKAVAFRSNRDGRSLFEHSLDLGSEDKMLLRGGSLMTMDVITVGSWSLENGHFAYTADGDIWVRSYPITGEEPKQLTRTATIESHPRFSPDGLWLAYQSNASGMNEIYLQPFLRAGETRKISTRGGIEPRWSRKNELLFLEPDGAFISVSFDGSLMAETNRTRLFQTDYGDDYGVAPDGNFLMKVPEDHAAPMAVILNWVSAFKK